MAFERGGRADKLGNRYEDLFVVSQYVKLLQGDILGITVEPSGSDESGVDVLVETAEHVSIYYQCKSRNGNADRWTFSTLDKNGFFKHAKEHLRNDNDRYYWVSPLPCTALFDLCQAARNTSSAEVFFESQLATKSRAEVYEKIAKYFGLAEDTAKAEKMLFYLKRISFVAFLDDNGQQDIINTSLEYLFWGNGQAVFDRLLAFSKEDHFGQCITQTQLVAHLENAGYTLSDFRGRHDIIPRIRELKEEFKQDFFPIGNNLVETPSVQNAVESILDAKCNVLILGTPGSGKSGVVQWVVRHLEKNYVPVLPLRLDRVIPKTNSYQYGIDLGLPASPVHCLSCMLSSGQNGILILDQMDSLRWTGIHAPKALSICGEMIRQAQVYNAAPSGGQIRVICICRTFDLENTQEINRLFCVEEIVETNWDKVYINGWTEEDILKIIGIKKMSRLLPRTIELLKSPNNLSIWLKLSEDVQQTQLNSEYDLVEKWYQQVMSHAQLKKLNIDRIDLAISEIVTKMQDRGNVPETALKSALQCERDFCSSEGIIIQRNGQVVFPHQSVPDYFRVKDMIKGVYARENIEDIVLRNCEKQIPQHRILLQTLWETLRRLDLSYFLDIGAEFVAAPSIRFYYKCTFWEAFSQIENVDGRTLSFLKKHWDMPEWKDVLRETVIRGHFAFVEKMIGANLYACWTEPEALSLLRSVIETNNEFVYNVLQPLVFVDEERDRKIFYLISPFMKYDCDNMFHLRMDLLERYPAWFNRSLTLSMAEDHPDHFIDCLLFVLRHWNICNSINAFGQFSDKLVVQKSDRILSEILPAIIQMTAFNGSKNNCETLDRWSNSWGHYYNGRVFVRLLEKTIAYKAEENKNFPKQFLEDHWEVHSSIEKELVMKVLRLLPVKDASLAYTWFLQNFPENLFEYTSENNSEIGLACEILRNISPYWSYEELNTFAEKVCGYNDPQALKLAQQRFQWNREARIHKQESCYSAFWGSFQQCVLPCLDVSRLKKKYIDQIQVLLRRKTQYDGEYRFAKGGLGEVTAVSSPVSNHAKKLSAHAWVKLLLSKKVERRGRGSRNRPFGIESTHEQYARDFEGVMADDPVLFHQIIKLLPAQIDEQYVLAILYLIEKASIFNELAIEGTCELLNKFVPDLTPNTCANIIIAYCNCISSHAKADWPDTILDKVLYIAEAHPHPASDEFVVTSSSDPNHISRRDLLDNGNNCVRGAALRALSQFFMYHAEKTDKIKCCVAHGVNDGNPAVRYVLLDCVSLFLGRDNTFAWKCFTKLVSLDIRIIGHHHVSYFVIEFFAEHKEFFLAQIESVLNSENSELIGCASKLLAGIFVYYGEFKEVLFRQRYPSYMAKAIVEQLVHTLSKTKYEERSKECLIHVLSHSEDALGAIEFRLFSDTISTDTSFSILDSLSQLHFKALPWSVLLEKIRTLSDVELDQYYGSILHACDLIVRGSKGEYRSYYEEDLICILLRLLENHQGSNSEINQCLDLLDLLFRENAIKGQNLLKKLQE